MDKSQPFKAEVEISPERHRIWTNLKQLKKNLVEIVQIVVEIGQISTCQDQSRIVTSQRGLR